MNYLFPLITALAFLLVLLYGAGKSLAAEPEDLVCVPESAVSETLFVIEYLREGLPWPPFCKDCKCVPGKADRYRCLTARAIEEEKADKRVQSLVDILKDD